MFSTLVMVSRKIADPWPTPPPWATLRIFCDWHELYLGSPQTRMVAFCSTTGVFTALYDFDTACGCYMDRSKEMRDVQWCQTDVEHHIWYIKPVLFLCWPAVGTTSKQHRVNVSCLLGYWHNLNSQLCVEDWLRWTHGARLIGHTSIYSVSEC